MSCIQPDTRDKGQLVTFACFCLTIFVFKKILFFDSSKARRREMLSRAKYICLSDIFKWKSYLKTNFCLTWYLKTWYLRTFPNAWSKKQNIPSSTWPGGHISYAESKHIYCSFISIYHKLSLLRQADAKPQFASKVSSLDVANSPRSLSHVTQPLKNQLGNPASFANCGSPGTTPSLSTRGSWF